MNKVLSIIIALVLIIPVSHGFFYATMLGFDAAPESCDQVTSWCHEIGPVTIYDLDTPEAYAVSCLNLVGFQVMDLIPKAIDQMALDGLTVIDTTWEKQDITVSIWLHTDTGHKVHIHEALARMGYTDSVSGQRCNP